MANELGFVAGLEAPTITQTLEGPVATLGDITVPVFDTVLDVAAVQPGSVRNNKELAPHVAKFHYKDMGEFKDELTVLPIAIINKGRRLFSEYGSGDNSLLCYSNNGCTPSAKVDSPLSEACGDFIQRGGREFFDAVCPKASWDNGRPDCGETLTVGLFDLEYLIPIKIQLKGTGISAWNKFKREYNKYENIARLKKTSINDYVIKMRLENEGNYVSYHFDFVEAKEENPKKYQNLLYWYQTNLMSFEGDKEGNQEHDTGTQDTTVDAVDASQVNVDTSSDGDSTDDDGSFDA